MKFPDDKMSPEEALAACALLPAAGRSWNSHWDAMRLERVTRRYVRHVP
jgi:hypothetical protein